MDETGPAAAPERRKMTKFDRQFQGFVEEQGSSIYRFVLRLVDNQQDAEDLTQEALLRVYRTAEKLDGREESLLAWGLRIARNLVIDYRRRRRAVLTEGDVLDQSFEGHQLCAEEIYDRNANAELIATAIDNLPHQFREVLVLRYQSELSYEDIATVLDVPLTTVETRLFRAKKNLRALLQAKGIKSSAG
ncbi:MAG TPA: sigma-70 family RNA polymerase sigma factor [Planctomycetota bacterium]|nr:sigma-70 family RNA polymerase sigma factor [Planctomycetota bacterium]